MTSLAYSGRYYEYGVCDDGGNVDRSKARRPVYVWSGVIYDCLPFAQANGPNLFSHAVSLASKI